MPNLHTAFRSRDFDANRRKSPIDRSNSPQTLGRHRTVIHWPTEELVALGGAGAGVVGIEGGVVSGVINLESSGVEAPDWRPRHDERYHEARAFAAPDRNGCASFR